LPKIEVIPKARNRSRTAARTVITLSVLCFTLGLGIAISIDIMDFVASIAMEETDYAFYRPGALMPDRSGRKMRVSCADLPHIFIGDAQ